MVKRRRVLRVWATTVLVDGWYDTAEPLSEEAAAALRAMPDWDSQLKQELGLAGTEGQPQTLPERLMWSSPTSRARGFTSWLTIRTSTPDCATRSWPK